MPPLEQAIDRLQTNRQALVSSGVAILSMPLAALREEARRQTFAAADHYSWEQGEPVAERADLARPLLVSGHQPELFHPGVWAKNFALAGLARRVSGLALNLLIDSDTLKSTTLRVPLSDGQLRRIPFDRWTGQTPWEERRVIEPETFAAFGPAVLTALEPWGYRPLLADLWEGLSRDVLIEKRLLGESFCRARRLQERAWGVVNREVPISRLWSLKSFAHLAGALLNDLPRFHAVHNDAVQEYRREHHITSLRHPVPDLEERAGWYEAPFWAWRTGSRRERLFARLDGPRMQLRFDDETIDLPAPTNAEFARAWCRLVAQGVHLRSRALITTMAARLLLADLFIHGLGGGLYDALTDVIVRDFFGLEPPGFLILTGTCRLPLGRTPIGSDAIARQKRLVRDLRYNPQRHRDDTASADLRAERQAWVERTPTTPTGRRERFHAIRRLNAALSAGLDDRLACAAAELTRLEEQRRHDTNLGRRDFSFVLYPEPALRSFVEPLLRLQVPTFTVPDGTEPAPPTP